MTSWWMGLTGCLHNKLTKCESRKSKTNELIGHLHPVLPQILCFMEHHMHWEELQQISMNDSKLATYFCITSYAKGGVCIYVHKSLEIESTDRKLLQRERPWSLCYQTKPKFDPHLHNTTYRAPSGNFHFFINKLDSIIGNKYNPALEFIICGDISMDYLKNNDKKTNWKTCYCLIISQIQ
jgi:hypothetical protein